MVLKRSGVSNVERDRIAAIAGLTSQIQNRSADDYYRNQALNYQNRMALQNAGLEGLNSAFKNYQDLYTVPTIPGSKKPPTTTGF
jgi:hypothetical protein